MSITLKHLFSSSSIKPGWTKNIKSLSVLQVNPELWSGRAGKLVGLPCHPFLCGSFTPITQLQRALLGSPGLFLADEELLEGTCRTVVPAATTGEQACAGHHHHLPRPHQVSHTGAPILSPTQPLLLRSGACDHPTF